MNDIKQRDLKRFWTWCGLTEQASGSWYKALKAMDIGAVKRIYHDDVACNNCGLHCTLVSTISRLRINSRGRIAYKQYHEDTAVMVVKRIR